MRLFSKLNITWFIIALLGFFAIDSFVYFGIIDPFYEITLVNILINIILALGLNLIVGYSGQLSLGHAGFMAIGAYTTGILTIENQNIGTFLISLVVGSLLAGVVALIVGIPTLRLKGDYLAVATLGFSEIIRIVILNMTELTNGAAGLSGIPFFADWQTAFALALICIILVANYTRSSIDRATIAIREDEVAAESIGVNTFRYKLIAFIIGAVTAAIAGSIHASYFGVINPGQFTFNKSIDVLIMVVFGGIGSLTGSIVAATALGILNMYLQQFGALQVIIYSLVLILIMIFKPTGLFGTKEFSLSKFFNKSSNPISNGKEG
ncbi:MULTISPECIES: branched-chain amino acid ABC transporter permease [Tetragenococcus]|uniref:Branched-chain amino acid transport system permease protein n=1 Tax=Tetragenococcus muriaticus 3MR10-3 TaxID=1302648 RepID=A0A091CBS5_9ENTE|nr:MULTISPECIES: branched-chain amino acid ABC transporter permease [Tetragenococcus]MDN6507438.1 branched-chain amino acid ABC transporter permease [Tetragenococcus halophilus]KFN89093.1 branched-chain amino acid transport system permease protein [Tetragenococcus muriaticus 3MR10-3]MCF1618071.1 branched-chain amino acid ABC transporter permease [Tetragenococcus koreensis]MCF1622127.1 branched-chain amino acid ABC transporter permease [Tetragenococcus koreensis]MCF1627405.1 branched-chain amin